MLSLFNELILRPKSGLLHERHHERILLYEQGEWVEGYQYHQHHGDPRRRGGRGLVHYDKNIYQGKGTCRTHLPRNCGELEINSSYRQCLVSIRASSTYFTALTLFDTGTYTSFINGEVTKWLEKQRDKDTDQQMRYTDVDVGLK